MNERHLELSAAQKRRLAVLYIMGGLMLVGFVATALMVVWKFAHLG